jgi:hypothetical protein
MSGVMPISELKREIEVLSRKEIDHIRAHIVREQQVCVVQNENPAVQWLQ